jgi:hypothetical protein
LPFGVVALDFRGAGFGHRLAVSPKDVKIKSKRAEGHLIRDFAETTGTSS